MRTPSQGWRPEGCPDVPGSGPGARPPAPAGTLAGGHRRRRTPHRRHGTRVLAAALTLALWPATWAAAQQIVVAPGTAVSTLGGAIAAAEPHDTIAVLRGVYREPTILVDRPVTILGEAGAVLDGEGARQIMRIEADSVTVRGLLFRGVGTSYVEDRAAITVEAATHCVIEDNRFEDTFFGIYLANAGWCRIAGNELRGLEARQTASGNGIHLWYSKEITVADNVVRGHRDGIYFEFVEDSRIVGNRSEGNLRYGLHFMFSDRCEYRDNLFRANGAGVAVMYTENVVMTDNVFRDNWGAAAFGLLLKDITDSRIAGNAFVGNTVGIHSEGSNRVVVERNEFTRNGWAIKIMANSMDNLFTRNNFEANTFDVATNSRQSYSEFDANFWDRYDGYDLDRDGVGDVPFRPVRLFSLLVERNEPALALLRSFFVSLLDAAERVVPALTPETLVDTHPLMRRAS